MYMYMIATFVTPSNWTKCTCI